MREIRTLRATWRGLETWCGSGLPGHTGAPALDPTKEFMTTGWQPARDATSMQLKEVAYNLNGLANHTFSSMFPIYDWENDNGYSNIGSWIDAAATQAGK